MRRASSPPRAVRSKSMQVAVLVVATAMMVFIAVRTTVVLAGLRPYFAAYWYAGLAAGAVVAVGMPVLSLRAMVKGDVPRWPIWLLVGYVMAVVTGTRLFSLAAVRVVPQPPSAPSPGAFLVLASVAFTATGLTEVALFVALGLASLLAPAPFRRARLRWQVRQGRRHPITAGREGRGARVPTTMPVRLQPPGHEENQPWLRGDLYITPGRLEWIPSNGAGGAPPVELTQATLIPAHQAARPGRSGTRSRFITVYTDIGEIRLTMDPRLFQLAQRAAAHPGRGSGRGGNNDRAKPR
jgi:hypothetical protein